MSEIWSIFSETPRPLRLVLRTLISRILRVSAFPALALAIALTYVIGDVFRPHLPQPVSIVLDIILCFVLYKVSNHYLRRLRE